MKFLRAFFSRLFSRFRRPKWLPLPEILPPAKPLKERTREAYRLQPGYAWNPLASLPRNFPCPCRSGKKFKACHLGRLAPAVETKEVPRLEAMVRAIESGRLPRESFMPVVKPKPSEEEKAWAISQLPEGHGLSVEVSKEQLRELYPQTQESPRG